MPMITASFTYALLTDTEVYNSNCYPQFQDFNSFEIDLPIWLGFVAVIK
jgi:hypothetical protein